MEDERLAARFLEKGDQVAFSLLVERYQNRVFRLVCSVLGPFRAAEAEDVTQEVFIKVFNKLKMFRGESGFRSWLYRLAYNTALDWRRKLVRADDKSWAQYLEIELVESDEALRGEDPLEKYLQQEQKLNLMRALETLPELYRTLIYLHYWLETPVEEVAEQLILPEGTVKSYLSRARGMLRRKLEKGAGSSPKDWKQNQG